jgi:anti-sigma factor RsiW
MTGTEIPVGEDDLQAAIDGRLTPERRAAVDAFLADHPDLAERVAEDIRLRDALRARLAAKHAEPIPTRLRVATLRAARRARLLAHARTIAAALVVFVAGAGTGALATRTLAPTPGVVAHVPAPAVVVAADAGAAHRTFVVEVAHPVEVDAAREAHLMQWLSKRLGRRLAAPDLSRFGWRLMGGRLLSVDTGAAAQLMYEDPDGRRLTVFVRASAGEETAFRFRRDGDTSTFAWIDRGFGFAVTAATDRERLLPVAEAVYHGFEGTAPPATGRG